MATFQYEALNAQGQQTSGTLEANSEAEATQTLRANGLYPTKLSAGGSSPAAASAPATAGASAGAAAKSASSKKKPTKSKKQSKSKAPKSKKVARKTGGKIKPKALMIFTRQLATLIQAGLPLLKSLTILGKQEPNPILKGTLGAISDSVQSGSTFSEALSQHPKIFNKLYINMVKAGELGGVLELVLARLADYMEKADKLKNKIVSAMVYPVIVMFIAVAILTFLMIFIVPKFKEMFADMGGQLPGISEFVFGISDFCMTMTVPYIPNIVWIFVAVLVGWFIFSAWSNTKAGRVATDNFKLKMPIFGDMQRKSAIARFTRTLGTLVTSGVPILQALNITKETSGNVIISNAIGKIYNAVKEGESVVQPMQSSGVFPDMVVSMVDVGEETGQLPDMLLKVADVYDDEVDSSVTALTSIIEPVMIVFLALIVGGIVFALFLPMIQIISTLQG